MPSKVRPPDRMTLHVKLLLNGSMLTRALMQSELVGKLGFSRQFLLSAPHAVSQLAPNDDSTQWYCRVPGGQGDGAAGG